MHRAFTLLITLGLARAQAEETCLSVEDDPYLLFGEKTAYISANRDLLNTRFQDVPGCQPQAFWLLNRHGTHRPEVDEINDLQSLTDLKNNVVSNYKNGNFRDTNHRMCTADVNLIEHWKWYAGQNTTFAGELTSDGYMSTQHMAQVWRQKFPALLSNNTDNYLFKYTTDKRSSETFRAFTEGLLGAQADGYGIPKENDEKIVAPHKSCPVWKKEVEENNATLSQRHIFETKLEFRDMISNISLRLGFNYDIHRETVRALYRMCRYNKAWDVSQISPWCAAFTKEDLKRLEYAEDLETFYKYGYGSLLHSKIGCLPVKDLINFFKNHIAGEIPQLPKAMITFTDAAMILTTLSALNTHQDPAPITGDNYRTNTAQARKWTTSTMAPFNGNVAAVLYKCTPNGNFQINDEHQVLFLENERPMYIEGCRVGLCDWSLVRTRYAELVGNCDMEFCNGAGRVGWGVSLTVIGVVVSRLSFWI